MATQRPKGASGGHKLARPMARSRPKASDARIRGSDARSSVSAGRPRTSAFPNGGGSFQFPSPPTGADLETQRPPFRHALPAAAQPPLRVRRVSGAKPSSWSFRASRATRSHYASSTAGRRPQSCMCMASPHSSPRADALVLAPSRGRPNPLRQLFVDPFRSRTPQLFLASERWRRNASTRSCR